MIQLNSKSQVRVSEVKKVLQDMDDDDLVGFDVFVEVKLGSLSAADYDKVKVSVEEDEVEGETEQVRNMYGRDLFRQVATSSEGFSSANQGDLFCFDYDNPGDGPTTRCGYLIKFSRDEDSALFNDLSVGGEPRWFNIHGMSNIEWLEEMED
jgi:hypothetical protein